METDHQEREDEAEDDDISDFVLQVEMVREDSEDDGVSTAKLKQVGLLQSTAGKKWRRVDSIKPNLTGCNSKLGRSSWPKDLPENEQKLCLRNGWF